MHRLRPELLRYATDDGGCRIVDLLLESVHAFSAAESAALDAIGDAPLPHALVELPPALVEKLQSCLLLENELAESLRQQAWAARIRRSVDLPSLPGAKGPWHRASELPSIVAQTWRQPERWRRLGEDAAAGRLPLALSGLLTIGAAGDMAEQAATAPMTRMDNNYCHASYHNARDATGAIGAYLGLLASPPFSELIGAVLRLQLPAQFGANLWQLTAGDHVGAHADGVRYVATLSLGLCAGWTAEQGGAIAFGKPTAQAFEVRERWLPHLGDAMLFRPEARAWHVVEPVLSGVRHTLTCQWIQN